MDKKIDAKLKANHSEKEDLRLNCEILFNKGEKSTGQLVAERNNVLAMGRDYPTEIERFNYIVHEIIQIDPLEVPILCLKRAERGQGTILRIFAPELIGKEIHIRSKVKPITSEYYAQHVKWIFSP